MIPLLFVFALAACKDGGNGNGDGGTGFPQCEADTEAEEAINLIDEVGLGVVGINAHRGETDDAITYTVDVHGDQADVTQLRFSFAGMPVVGMQYEVTEAMANDKVMILVLPASTSAEFATGTVTFTEVGTTTGETVAFDMDLQFSTGKLVGCIRSQILATGGTGTTDSGGSDTADSTG